MLVRSQLGRSWIEPGEPPSWGNVTRFLCASVLVFALLSETRLGAFSDADDHQVSSSQRFEERPDLDSAALEERLLDGDTAREMTDDALDQIDSLGRTSEFLDPEAASFDEWQPLTDECAAQPWSLPSWSPGEWFHDIGFRHSSTHGRNIGKGKPLVDSSWSNRPYHVDWFVGQLLGDELIGNRVDMKNGVIGGVRIGWDFDHYWGVEWRAGWAQPDISFSTPVTEKNVGDYFISDIDLVYYPWGDSRLRPYLLLGMGMTRVKFHDENSAYQSATLLTVPFGIGFQFPQWHWLIWRLEILDNAAFGSDYISAMGNWTFTVGMEWRLGARPRNYWPWRTSQSVW